MINKNPLAQYTTATEKHNLYTQSCATNTVAYKSDETRIPLRDVPEHNVEFIGGLWRVQDDFKYKITKIRDRQMILGQRIQHTEKTFFEYYQAALLVYNCYGPLAPRFDMIVAKYKTDRGTYWSYGHTIAEARAFMGIRLYDEYKDLIHSIACKKQLQKN